jgi:hypothetical protein
MTAHELAMKTWWVAGAALLIAFSGTAVGTSEPDAGRQQIIDRKESGLYGTTRSRIVSGVPGGQPTERPSSMEFAIAPIERGKTVYQNAMFVASDGQGQYRVVLRPGTYWIGPKSKVMDPTTYRPGAKIFAEKEVVVREGEFTAVDLLEVGYAP